MNAFLEENFKLNGTDSWIHCLEFPLDKYPRTEYHYHEYIEILFFLSGKGIVRVNGREISCTKNTLVVVNSQRAHAVDFLSPSQYICIKVMPDILYTDEFKYALPFISEVKNEYVFTASETEAIKAQALIQDIIQEWNNMQYGFEPAIRSKLLDFFVRILRHLHKVGTIGEVTDIRPEIKAAIIYIADNFATVTEHELASICHLSYNYFSHIFKKSLGKSFKEYLLDIKIRQAEKLLLSTDKTITEIAHMTGFSTTSHFISQFKNKKNITPVKYKKVFDKYRNPLPPNLGD